MMVKLQVIEDGSLNIERDGPARSLLPRLPRPKVR